MSRLVRRRRTRTRTRRLGRVPAPGVAAQSGPADAASAHADARARAGGHRAPPRAARGSRSGKTERRIRGSTRVLRGRRRRRTRRARTTPRTKARRERRPRPSRRARRRTNRRAPPPSWDSGSPAVLGVVRVPRLLERVPRRRGTRIPIIPSGRPSSSVAAGRRGGRVRTPRRRRPRPEARRAPSGASSAWTRRRTKPSLRSPRRRVPPEPGPNPSRTDFRRFFFLRLRE